MAKFKCGGCKNYFPVEKVFHSSSLQKWCSAECVSDQQQRNFSQDATRPARKPSKPRKEDIPVSAAPDVQTAENGRLFVWGNDGRGGKRKNYGELSSCLVCETTYFLYDRDKTRSSGFCSVSCSQTGDHNSKRVHPVKHPKVADKLFSQIVRSVGHCVHCGWSGSAGRRLECAHGFSRRYWGLRWDYQNAFCLCNVCHLHFTQRPLEWEVWLRDKWGDEMYDIMRQHALHDPKPEIDETARRLRADFTNIQKGTWKVNDSIR